MSLLTFSELKNTISKVRDNQANYQKVGLCLIASSPNHEVTREEFATVLKANNPKLGHEISYYKSKSCPVYKILEGKNCITVSKETVKGNFKLSSSQKNEISELCMGVLN